MADFFLAVDKMQEVINPFQPTGPIVDRSQSFSSTLISQRIVKDLLWTVLTAKTDRKKLEAGAKSLGFAWLGLSPTIPKGMQDEIISKTSDKMLRDFILQQGATKELGLVLSSGNKKIAESLGFIHPPAVSSDTYKMLVWIKGHFWDEWHAVVREITAT